MPEARGLVNFEDWYSMSWEKVRGHSRTLADTRGQSYEDNFSLEIVHGYHYIDIADCCIGS